MKNYCIFANSCQEICLTNILLLNKSVFILSLFAGLILSSCSGHHGEIIKKDTVAFDLDSIRSRGKLVVVSDFNSTNYFLYRGEPMGFHYELLEAFSDHVGIDLELVSENDLENAFDMLNSGMCDILAMGLTITPQRMKSLQFTEPLDSTRQVLVQRKPGRRSGGPSSETDILMEMTSGELARKTVFVQKGSVHAEWLSFVREQTGTHFRIVEVPFEAETLIELVSKGEIDYTVCDEHVAEVNSGYYPGIDVSTVLSSHQQLAWAVRKSGSENLKEELDRWIRSYKKTKTYAILYSKYFRNPRGSLIFSSDYYALGTGKVSPWDDLIKEYSAVIKWDWRLLASLIYQESRFIPDVVSAAGAYGLMQIMPETGKNFGIDIKSSPVNNIRAGIKYINWLHGIFDKRIPDPQERMKFILASYNAGPGHVLDAMKLAEKHGQDPTIWNDNVAVWLQRKSDPLYYRDEVVKNGYFTGKESVAFVSEVLGRYEHYKNIIGN